MRTRNDTNLENRSYGPISIREQPCEIWAETPGGDAIASIQAERAKTVKTSRGYAAVSLQPASRRLITWRAMAMRARSTRCQSV